METGEDASSASLGIVDYVLLSASMLFCALIGFYFSNKNKSIDSYMLGDRKLGVIPVAISLMTSCMSGISLLGSSAEIYYQGPAYAFVAIAMILAGPIIAYTILPVFYRMNQLSLYKYLHLRFGLLIKYVISPIFIVHMLFYNAIVLYLPAMALQDVIGLNRFYSILLIGLMCVLYSGIGGLKAVVWTDFFQAMLMYLSVAIVGFLGTYDAGGVGEIFSKAQQGGRLRFDGFFNFDLTTRHTLWGILAGSTIKHVYVIGVNQVQIQRALSLSSLKKAQYCFIICGFFVALISLLSVYLGLVLNSAYQSCDPYLAGEIFRRDAVIIHYVSRRLRKIPGLRGIFIAGIFSATLSTLSSFSNSMSALALEDYVKPIRKYYKFQQLSNGATTILAKIFATLFGLVCVLIAFLIDKANSRLMQASSTLFGAIGVPFLACFALGIFTRFINTKGILSSLLVTLTLGIYISIEQTFFQAGLEPQTPIYFNEQCESAFNGTIQFNQLPPVTELQSESFKFLPVEEPFEIGRISYMVLPVVQFMLTILIATLVSLLTGGWNQEVDDDYLVSILHRKLPKFDNPTIYGDQHKLSTFIIIKNKSYFRKLTYTN